MRGTLGRIVELCKDFFLAGKVGVGQTSGLDLAGPDWTHNTPAEDELENVILVRALKSEAKLTLHQSNGAASDTQSVCR